MSSLRSIIEHPLMDLTAVYVYTDSKVGQDAGTLCGTAPTGIAATREIAAILASQPDCVMYMPLLDHESIDDICTLLEAGINIVTTSTGLHFADILPTVTRDRIEKACQSGSSSLYDTGSCPGFITEVLPLGLLTMERRLERLTIDQYADLSTRKSPVFLAKFFGIDPATANHDEGATRTATTDGASLQQIAKSMGVPLDEIKATSTTARATATTELAVMTIKEGSVGSWRQDVLGMRNGQPLLVYRRTMYVTKELDPDWQVLDTGWHITIDGDAPMELDLRWSTRNYGEFSPGINANLPINSVPAVCAADPGILTTADLRITPYFG